MPFEWLDDILYDVAVHRLGVSTFDLNPLIAVVLIGLTCGLVGSLVVGNRMAFFSDAMAHTAFAGAALALVGVVVVAGVRSPREADPYLWSVPLVMAVFGSLVGAAIAWVRERTGLTHDTVIGVFFAFAIGLGAMVIPQIKGLVNIDAEQFLFGSVTVARGEDLFTLAVLTLVTAAVVAWRFNAFLFGTFNPSLARSRGLSVRANNYLFIVLLALVVNLSIKAVGVLLINALLVVPAAAAANLGRNVRQVFWLTLAGSVGAGVLGQQISARVDVPLPGGRSFEPGTGGTIVVLCVLWFFVTMVVAAVRGRAGGGAADRSG